MPFETHEFNLDIHFLFHSFLNSCALSASLIVLRIKILTGYGCLMLLELKCLEMGFLISSLWNDNID